MNNNILKTSEEWLKDPQYAGLVILDPDGWDRRADKFDYAWFEEKITNREFEQRVHQSTIKWSLGKL